MHLCKAKYFKVPSKCWDVYCALQLSTPFSNVHKSIHKLSLSGHVLSEHERKTFRSGFI